MASSAVAVTTAAAAAAATVSSEGPVEADVIVEVDVAFEGAAQTTSTS
jgi:hypothetical protein